MITKPLVAALSLAAAVLAATPALAAPAQLDYSDLDLSTKAGQKELSSRIDKAATRFCVGETITGSIGVSPACRAAVREELRQKVAARAAGNRLAANH